MKVTCDNCGWTGDADTALPDGLSGVENLHDRLDPGCEVPAGECPTCYALAYLDPSDYFEKFPDTDWMYEVANKDTTLGYHQWLLDRVRSEQMDAALVAVKKEAA